LQRQFGATALTPAVEKSGSNITPLPGDGKKSLNVFDEILKLLDADVGLLRWSEYFGVRPTLNLNWGDYFRIARGLSRGVHWTVRTLSPSLVVLVSATSGSL